MLCGRRARVRYDNSHRDRPPRRGQPHCMKHGRLSVLMRNCRAGSPTLSCLLYCTRMWTLSRLARRFPIGATGRAPEAASLNKSSFPRHIPLTCPPCAGSCTFDGHHFSDESEAAHWGLFLNNFTQHVLDTYGAPDKWAQSAQARSVAAFLFGLRSHQVRARAVCRALTCESAAHAAACTYDRAVNGCSSGRRSVALGP
jgi:hypothetical protein